MRPVTQALRNPQDLKGILEGILLQQLPKSEVNYFVSMFLDDLLGLIDTYENGIFLIRAVVQLLSMLGLVFHPRKSVLIPT